MDCNANSEFPAKKALLMCSFGEKCCSKNIEHFKNYEHPHLDSVLKRTENVVKIPSDIKIQISETTFCEQLQLVKDLKTGAEVTTSPFAEKDYNHDVLTSLPARIGCICKYGEKCFQKNVDHLKTLSHPHLDKLLLEMGDSTAFPENYTFQIRATTLSQQLEIIRSLREQPSVAQLVETTNEPDSNPVQEEESLKRNYNAVLDANEYYDEVTSLSSGDIAEKLALSEPYNFFLTSITGSDDLPIIEDDPLAISFQGLLSPAMGQLVNSLQINCFVEIEWLFEQYRVAKPVGPPLPLTLLYSTIMDLDLDDVNPMPRFLSYAKVKTPSDFGSHHTKMMVFEYADKSVRIVVSTANLYETEWRNKTQGLWISPKCPELPEGSTENDGESCTNFKRDLLRYFKTYNLPQLQYWISYLSKIDMSSIKVFFVASVPGTYTHDRNNWGLCALSKIVKDHVTTDGDPKNWRVYAQCSSIGSLGRTSENSLLSKIRDALCPDGSTSPIKFIFPSENDVRRSYEGLLGGGCLSYSAEFHQRQKWVEFYFCNWVSNKRTRTRAVPHIKSYARASSDNTKLACFVLTSANVSKAAWGSLTTFNNKTNLYITSYEAGVVFVPKMLIQNNYFPLQENENFAFPLPFDLPTINYTLQETPWLCDILEKYRRDNEILFS